MKTIEWSGYNWISEERWGNFHHEKPIVWYDESCIEELERGVLNLKSHWNPTEIKINNKVYKPNVGVGLISSTHKFEYGTFSLEAKLPKLAYSWPAFWMWSWDTWPPEIDVFEAYSNKHGSYLSSFWDILAGRFWKIESNLHAGKTPNNFNLGAKTHPIAFTSPTDDWHKYEVSWFPDVIEFRYDDKLVRRVNPIEMGIKDFMNTKMNVVINNSIYKEDESHQDNAGNFLVHSFKYTKW